MANESTSDQHVSEMVGDAFLAAARAGEVAAIEATLRADHAVVYFSDKRDMTALHKAAINGHKKVAEILLGANAALDARDIGG